MNPQTLRGLAAKWRIKGCSYAAERGHACCAMRCAAELEKLADEMEARLSEPGPHKNIEYIEAEFEESWIRRSLIGEKG